MNSSCRVTLLPAFVVASLRGLGHSKRCVGASPFYFKLNLTDDICYGESFICYLDIFFGERPVEAFG